MRLIKQMGNITAKADASYYIPTKDVAIADINGWNSMLNADYFYQDNSVLDMVNGNTVPNTSSATLDANIKVVKGNKFFNTLSDVGGFFRFPMPSSLNPSEFTVVYVGKPDNTDFSGNLSSIVVSNDNDNSGTQLKMAFNATRTQIGVWGIGGLTAAANPIILHTLSQDERSKVSCYVLTFSTHNGFKLFINGVLVASNPDEVRERTSVASGEWAILRGNLGESALVGVLSRDISDSQDLARITTHFISRYQ